MRVYVHAPREDWIVDRIAQEFTRQNRDICVSDAQSADVIWAPAGWCVDQLVGVKRPIVATVHHLFHAKPEQALHVAAHDRFVTSYHVPNVITKRALESVTAKPITVLPYWVNLDMWHPITQDERSAIRSSLGISSATTLIGSFQRDTEGSDGMSPKLEKGPDIFCEYVEQRSRREDVCVLLCGYRRQYVISRLKASGVRTCYIERAPADAMRWLYGSLDLYVVSSRCEGGPQALLECAACAVPIISTPVGMAADVLSPSSVCEDLSRARPDVECARAAAHRLSTATLFPRYREMLVTAKESGS